jgi:IS30 family transposase
MVVGVAVGHVGRIGLRCGGPGGRSRASSRSVGGCVPRWKRSSSGAGLRDRSPVGWCASFPTMRRCACRTRRSISRCSCSRGARCPRNSPAILRTGRVHRRRRGQRIRNGQGQIPGLVHISERPAEADDRAVPGHWEGDLLFGQGISAVATLVERHSRFVMLIGLPTGHTADVVADALAAKILELPARLRRSLTWDQGKEMDQHARFTVATGVPVYFCDPKSPWQRGSNENTNGLLRQYLPRTTSMSDYPQARLDAIAAELNDRPRQTLGWRSPSQALDQAMR